ncbi:hypothetical protein AAG570_013236 [Ranatra chinensis]|uniref:Uncharacterized protein n=1 Tax=Ranatra chinensis TaxID=642074 RepID=A0ABD0Z2F8_9HEMI
MASKRRNMFQKNKTQERTENGRYSCCGEKAFRFEILSKATGCQYRSHVSSHTHKYASQMNKISEKLGSEIFIDPPELKLQEKRTCFIQQNCGGSSESSNLLTHMDEFWWHGLEITPSKKPPHLLLKLNHNRDVKCQPEPKGNESPVPHSFCQRHVCSNPDLYDSSSLNEEHGDESPVHLNNNCKHQIHHKCINDAGKFVVTEDMSLVTAPILQFLDFTHLPVLGTDNRACRIMLGAVLSQVENEEDRPVAYASLEDRLEEKEEELLALRHLSEQMKGVEGAPAS